MTLEIGRRVSGEPAPLDLEHLVSAHLAVVANAGAGKSGLIRKVLETTYGQVQQIVLDPEDEFYTLREGGDYLVAGGEDGDCPATVGNAAELATMLLTHGISAVVQLNHLHADEQAVFVRNFVEALMEAPRALWHPMLLVLDEAHRWAPQDGTSAASAAVQDFTSRGRKRGFTAVLATQRSAKLNKNVTDSVNNWAFGRVGQATDRRVAADALGFSPTSAEGRSLQGLPARTFWVFGQAFGALAPVQMMVGDCKTTIIRPGQDKVPTPPPPEALREILAKMAADAAAAAEKAAQEAAARVSASKGSGDGAETAQGPSQVEIDALVARASVTEFRRGRQLAFEEVVALLEDLRDRVKASAMEAAMSVASSEAVRTVPLRDMTGTEIGRVDAKAADEIARAANGGFSVGYKVTPPAPRRVVTGDAGARKCSKAVESIIAFYEAIYPRAVPFVAAARQAGVGMKSSQFKTYEPEMVESGRVEALADGRYRGFVASGSPADYLDKVAAQLTPAQERIFRFVRHAGRPVTKDEIVLATDVSPTSSTTSGTLALLMNEADVVEKVGDKYVLAEAFR